MAKNICIVHFNTPALTACLIRSINKYTPGANIFVFDNSDKKPFINDFENVTVFDNTQGQIINFTEWLNNYPSRLKSHGKVNNYGSAKHSISIQKCIELIDENFVLIDSDVLLKRDISGIWDGKYYWVGGVERWSQSLTRKRVCPFLLYLNVSKMKENNITFFDDKHMFGLNNGPKCDEYDTGCWLYERTLKKGRIIKYTDYIVHFRAGSWLHDARTKHNYKQMDPKKWLLNNKKYWAITTAALPKDWYERLEKEGGLDVTKTEPKKVTKTKMTFSDAFDHIYCLHNLPDSSRLPKLKGELERVGIDENAPYFSWKYDFPSPTLDCLFDDKRLDMDSVLRSTSRGYIKRASMRHYEIIKEAYALGYERILILENDVRFHKDLDYIGKMLENLPNTDVVLLDKMTCSSAKENIKYKDRVKKLPEGTLYADMKDIFFIFASCYALNRKGMQHIIERQEKTLLPPDTPFNDSAITGSFAVVNVAIQDPNLKTNTTERYDRINLDVTRYGGEAKKPVQNIQPTPEKPVKTIQAIREEISLLVKPPTMPLNRLEPVKTTTNLGVAKKPETKPKGKPEAVRPRRKEEIRLPVAKKKVVKNNAAKVKNLHTRRIYPTNKNYNKLYDIME